MNKSKNPLYTQQREKSGPKTFMKYLYQYNWALFQVIQNHDNSKDYAVFVELHEDVVTTDSLDLNKARFIFNQVKTDGRKFNELNLTKQKKGSSYLGKLLDSCLKRKYGSLIDEINFVAVNGFNLNLKDPKIQKEKVCITDLKKESFEDIETKIKAELSCAAIPNNIYFITPQVSEVNQQQAVIAEISKLMNSLFPSAYFNPISVYRALADELTEKGINTFDYEHWEDAIKRKALTSTTVSNVINTFSNPINDSESIAEINQICIDLNLNTIERRQMKKCVNRYKINRTGRSDLKIMKFGNELQLLINKYISECNGDLEVLISLVIENLSPKNKAYMNDQNDLKGAIIYEFSISN